MNYKYVIRYDRFDDILDITEERFISCKDEQEVTDNINSLENYSHISNILVFKLNDWVNIEDGKPFIPKT